MLAVLILGVALSQGSTALLRVPGNQFAGGAKALYGDFRGGERVNYAYARSNGPTSKLILRFQLSSSPGFPTELFLRGRDDETPARCRISISINGLAVFEGADPLSDSGWSLAQFPVPKGVLKPGENELVIQNEEPSGKQGMPPWIMIAEAAIAERGYRWSADIVHDFSIHVPAIRRSIPEPLRPGQAPGFPLRGIKGWMWLPQTYLKQIPFLASHKMNFLMNCYGSMCDIEHYRWGDPRVNRWWEPLPKAKKQAYKQVVRLCQKDDIEFCFSMNPNLCSKRPLRYDSKEDLEALWPHYAWMQSLGVHWFNISLDDIGEGIDAPGQARLANEFFRRLRAKDPKAELILCPTWYWGDGTDPEQKPYLVELARDLDPRIYLFWTGDQVVGPITKRAADSYKSIVRHRLFLWDNYPVNDDNPTMHLGPVIHRDPDLCRTIDGYMSNSMCKQSEAGRISLLTCADYAYNPNAYDPARSIGQSILALSSNGAQREALKDLVELYPGTLLFGGGTSYNPAREQFARLSTAPHPKFALASYLQGMQDLDRRFAKAFPDRFTDARATLEQDIAWIKAQIHERFGD